MTYKIGADGPVPGVLRKGKSHEPENSLTLCLAYSIHVNCTACQLPALI